MSLLDRLLRRRDPGRDRVAAAYAAGVRTGQRSFAAAQIGNLTADWTTTPISSDQAIYANLRTLRARSREQWRNNDYARRFVNMTRANVIGPSGILLQSRVRDANGGEDRLACQAIEDAWRDWSRRTNCDLLRRSPWTEIQRTFVSSVAMDGEALVRIHYVPDQPPYRFALQFIDPELLDINTNIPTLPGGGSVRMGIESDNLGRPVAYHLLTSYDPSSPGRRTVRIPAREIIHAFVPDLVGQTRGIPWMATALLRLRNVGEYETSALVAARVGANKVGFYQSEDGTGYTGDGTDSAGNQTETLEPGTFGNLPKGTTIATWSPEYPRGEFPDFIKSSLRGIASGLGPGVAYSSLSGDLEGVNYSSIRAGVIEEREAWKTLQEWTVESFCRPIFDAWLTQQIALQTIRVPTRSGGLESLNPAREDRYHSAEFQPRRWSWVDPKSDMEANQLAIDLLLASPSQIIREQGQDPEDLLQEIAAWRKKVEKYGLGSEENATTVSPRPPTPDQPEDDQVEDDQVEDDDEEPEPDPEDPLESSDPIPEETASDA